MPAEVIAAWATPAPASVASTVSGTGWPSLCQVPSAERARHGDRRGGVVGELRGQAGDLDVVAPLVGEVVRVAGLQEDADDLVARRNRPRGRAVVGRGVQLRRRRERLGAQAGLHVRRQAAHSRAVGDGHRAGRDRRRGRGVPTATTRWRGWRRGRRRRCEAGSGWARRRRRTGRRGTGASSRRSRRRGRTSIRRSAGRCRARRSTSRHGRRPGRAPRRGAMPCTAAPSARAWSFIGGSFRGDGGKPVLAQVPPSRLQTDPAAIARRNCHARCDMRPSRDRYADPACRRSSSRSARSATRTGSSRRPSPTSPASWAG